ncbi:hypothetical protein AKJ09_01690 [Labilithrix luteola]|uniref:Uncharacterized protein n=1 Tax=Labilithrix luteola TaxID=1391654 RepID=A0A0K1PNP7_9BACT|nr:hypothetical protein AKJ09_01690 [Labilithrix luteola]
MGERRCRREFFATAREKLANRNAFISLETKTVEVCVVERSILELTRTWAITARYGGLS